MPVLCRPAVATPEYVITLEKTLEMTREVHAKHPSLDAALRLIKNVGVQKRHIVRPIAEILDHPGFEVRNAVYSEEAKKRIPPVVDQALAHAGLQRSQIDAIIMVSCTGFVMPSFAAWMINAMGFRPDVVQIPIAQLGCAAGGSSVNRAYDFCMAHPGSNALIVTCEFCSLCYQPTDLEIGNLLSNALFGDAIACALVRGKGGQGISLIGHRSHLLPNTETWIAYEVKATGFHFRLNKGVPGTMKLVTPALQEFVKSHGRDMSKLDYYIVHTGGPKVLDTLRDHAGIDEPRLEFSRSTLREYGNIASASIFDVARRIFEQPKVEPGCLILDCRLWPGNHRRTGAWHLERRMSGDLYFEDFEPGAVFRHWPGKTVTEADHVMFCLLTHNNHPIHLDAHYSETATRHGKLLVVSSYLFSVLLGISVADMLPKATRHLDFESLHHSAPVFHGDTIYGESTVLSKELPKEDGATGVVSFETRGYKQDGTLVITFKRRVAIRRASHAASEPARYSAEYERNRLKGA